MNQELITLLQVNSGMKFVKVVFLHDNRNGDNTYTYKNLVAPDLAVHDLVVVQTRDTFSLARVIDNDVHYLDLNPSIAYRHVVSKVDLTVLDQVAQQERTLARRMAEAELKRRMADLMAGSGLTTTDLALAGVVPPAAPQTAPKGPEDKDAGPFAS